MIFRHKKKSSSPCAFLVRMAARERNVPPILISLFFNFKSILSITSLLGNIPILFSLQYESLLHPPSKLSFRCLSCTDLLVGLVSQPMLGIHYTAVAEEKHNLCEVTKVFGNISGVVLCGPSITTLTMISVDKLFALLLKSL